MKRALLRVLLFSLLLCLIACGKKAKVFPLEPDEDQRDITVSDMLGGQLRLEEAAQRILVFSPSACSILVDLGATDRISAKITTCQNEELKQIPEINAIDLLRSQSLDAWEGDLIMADASQLSLDTIDRIYKESRALLVLDIKSAEDMYRATEILGKALGKNLAAKELVISMSTQWENLKEQSSLKPKERIYIEEGLSGLGLGKETYISRLFEDLGFENVNKSKENSQFTLEELRQADPDRIIILGDENQDRRRQLDGLRASSDKRLYFFNDSSQLYGPRFVEIFRGWTTSFK